MNYNELYWEAKQILGKAGLSSSAFDALCLLEEVFDFDRQRLIMEGTKEAEAKKTAEFFALVNRRSMREPLQYIIGKWEFMNCTFFVGKGVLIPREDTSVVINLCVRVIEENFKNKQIKILDLCAGSGAISVVLAKLIPNRKITALELSDTAFTYLQKNIAYNNASNVTAIKGNVFTSSQEMHNEKFDVIISNPPYIQSEEIDTLQPEVKSEPRLALDGGADGLDFYKVIIEKWVPLLNKEGILAFELGEGQKEAVSSLMKNAGFLSIKTAPDIGGTQRAIVGARLR
ncbi:release factor glutamine methyltransferase [Clostridia bacterium]|nr:release factor glutamine methyltransferase [Clostridia bacterium]